MSSLRLMVFSLGFPIIFGKMASQFYRCNWRSIESRTACRQVCWNLHHHHFPRWYTRDNVRPSTCTSLTRSVDC
ncbi:hypothetical protein AAZV13_12G123900 [Glycine max]